ncbi:hypothetical protein SDC9_201541 [bioreactor metagenome]|uniref:Uncharacterized protein n=1 Tax=bioreactor metagenome TaxID=1076179 RepID=A0A645J334_9ZZZZ
MAVHRFHKCRVLLRAGPLRSLRQAFPGGADAGQGGFALLHQLPGEVYGVAVMGAQQEKAHGLQVELLGNIAHQAEIA